MLPFCILALVIIGIWPVFRSPAKVYEFPVFMSLVVGIFIIPQVLSLTRYPGSTPEAAVTSALIMTCLCQLACILGYKIPLPIRNRDKIHREVNEDRLFQGAIVFTLISLYFRMKILKMSDEELGSTWTGNATIFQFFAGIVFLAIAVLLRRFLAKPTLASSAALLLAVSGPLYSVVFSGRREQAAQLVITFGLTLYFEKRVRPPLIAIISLSIFAMVMIPATGSYRTIAKESSLKDLNQLDLIANFKDYLSKESVLELRNAAMMIYSAETFGNYRLGIGYWDEIIWRFVPAQLIGKDFKDSLMITRGHDRLFSGAEQLGHTFSSGSTLTGIGDSFGEFGYLGSLVFFALAVFYRRLWVAARRPQGIFSKLLYIALVTSAMRALTHQTIDFPPALIYQLVFLGLLYFYASSPGKEPKKKRVRRRRVRPNVKRINRVSTHKWNVSYSSD